jgi:hypothetical protein
MTRKLASDLAEELRSCSPDEISLECYDLMPGHGNVPELDDETIAVIGMPVCIGKIPMPGVGAIKSLNGNGAMTFAAVAYGSRSYGNALYELQHCSEQQGFKVVGAGAFSSACITSGLIHQSGERIVDQTALTEFSKAAAAKVRRLAGCDIEGLRIKPAPLEVSGKLPVHKISRISPKAAAAAQGLLERLCIRSRASEWYL